MQELSNHELSSLHSCSHHPWHIQRLELLHAHTFHSSSIFPFQTMLTFRICIHQRNAMISNITITFKLYHGRASHFVLSGSIVAYHNLKSFQATRKHKCHLESYLTTTAFQASVWLLYNSFRTWLIPECYRFVQHLCGRQMTWGTRLSRECYSTWPFQTLWCI